jgi:hypothetical protein
VHERERNDSLEGARLDISNLGPRRAYRDQLYLKNIYATDNAICVVFDEEKPDNGAQMTSTEGFERYVGNIMRAIRQLAQQVGLFAPCFCIMLLSNTNSELWTKAMKARHNQNWHRGDFAVLVYDADDMGEDTEAHIRKILFPISYYCFRTKLERIDTRAFVQRIDAEVGSKDGLSDEQVEILDTVKGILVELGQQSIVDDTKAFEERFNLWVEMRIEEIEGLVVADGAG